MNAVPRDLKVYLLGSAADQDVCDEIKEAIDNEKVHVINLAGQLSPLQSAALMEMARMNFVNDSGPMHFASAVNASISAVYCSTVPAFGFGPLSDVSHIIQTPAPLSCRPCGLHGHKSCPEGHFKCAKNIKTDQLLSVLAV